MARIICVFPAMTGILHSSLELANRLRAAGHDVLLGCPWDMREPVERHGFEYVQFDPIDFDPAPAAEHGPSDGRVRRALRSLATARGRREEAVAVLEGRRFASRVAELDIDLVVIDMELHEFVLTAVHRGLPVVLLSQFFQIAERRGLPPIDSSLLPVPVGSAGRASIRWAWLTGRLRRLRWQIEGSLRSLFTDRRAILRSYAKRTGFPLRRLHSDTFLQPFTYGDMPMLRMTDAALDFPHEVDSQVRSVGPMVFVERDRTQGIEEDSPLRRALREAEVDGRRLIYCSVTTVGGADLSLLRRITEVAARRPEWVVVIGLGGTLEPEALGALPDNVTALGWVPQLDVLARADLSISHGGVNTIHECIHFRVPMLVYSGKKHDQNGCAARMAYHGLGLVGDKDLDGVTEIEDKIERVLSESSFSDNVEAAHARYRAMRDEGALNRAVEELIAARRSTNSNPSETNT